MFLKVHADFERAQINAFGEIFGMSILFVGCQFHYIKPLYHSLKTRGLMK